MAYVFGCSVGTTLTAFADNIIMGTLYACSSNTNIRSLYVYGAFNFSASRKIVMAIYNSGGTLLEETYEMTGSGRGTGTYGVDLKSEVAVSSGQNYWLMLNRTPGTFNLGKNFALIQGSDTLDNLHTYDTTMPSTLPSDLDNVADHDIDIYADDTWINPPPGDGALAAAMSVL